MPSIVADHLTKTYKNAVTAASDVAFEVEAGEVFGLLGPNGAGKTTVIGMLTGQIRPSSGRALVGGFDAFLERDGLRGLIGVVFEHQNLYERLTGRENLAVFASLLQVPGSRVDGLLKQFGLEDRARDQVRNYSRGMKQRLLIARAMLDDPPVLFMDEPTSGLDPHVAQEVHDLIRRLRDEGRTVVLTTHYMEEASGLCDRVAILNHGRIVQTGSPHRMMVEHGEQKVRVEVRDGERTRTVELPLVDAADELHSLLAEHQLVTIHSIEATLQQVFIKLTGGDGNR